MKGKQGEGKGCSYPPSGRVRVHCKTDNSEADISRAIWKGTEKRLENLADMGVLLLKEPALGSLEEMSYISCGFGLFLKKEPEKFYYSGG